LNYEAAKLEIFFKGGSKIEAPFKLDCSVASIEWVVFALKPSITLGQLENAWPLDTDDLRHYEFAK